MRGLQSQIHKDRKQNGGCQGLGVGKNGELVFNRYEVSVWEDREVLEIDGGDDCTTMCIVLIPPNYMLKMVTMVNLM